MLARTQLLRNWATAQQVSGFHLRQAKSQGFYLSILVGSNTHPQTYTACASVCRCQDGRTHTFGKHSTHTRYYRHTCTVLCSSSMVSHWNSGVTKVLFVDSSSRPSLRLGGRWALPMTRRHRVDRERGARGVVVLGRSRGALVRNRRQKVQKQGVSVESQTRGVRNERKKTGSSRKQRKKNTDTNTRVCFQDFGYCAVYFRSKNPKIWNPTNVPPLVPIYPNSHKEDVYPGVPAQDHGGIRPFRKVTPALLLFDAAYDEYYQSSRVAMYQVQNTATIRTAGQHRL